MRWAHFFAACVVIPAAMSACSSPVGTPQIPKEPGRSHTAVPRNWDAHPVVEEVTPSGDLYAVSDIHGAYDRFVALLSRYHLIDGPPPSPSMVEWTGANATLLVVGDMINKGPKSLQTLQLVKALQESASASGGRVIASLGNHEAEFLAEPTNSRASGASGIDVELDRAGIDPAAISSGRDPLGQWLLDLPLAIHSGSWFFAHAGQTGGQSLKDLSTTLREAIDRHPDFSDPQIVGNNSILEAKAWYQQAAVNVRALGVEHIVFGHQPSALGRPGTIARTTDASLFRIDCGMSPEVNDSSGRMLRVRKVDGREVAESLDPDGNLTLVWASP